MFPYRTLAALSALCALVLACADESERPAAARDAGRGKARAGDASDARGEGRACEVPKSCERLDVQLFTYEVCCTETIACGWDLSPVAEAYEDIVAAGQADEILPPGFDPKKPCMAKPALFVFVPGLPEEHIELDGGDEIEISPRCNAVNWSGFTLPGCCLPDDSCGVSTHINQATLNSYANDPSETFATPACLSSAQFNAALEASELAPVAFLPKLSGRCR